MTVMKKLFLFCGILLSIASILSCYHEPGEISCQLYINNKSGYDIRFTYYNQGVNRIVTVADGEKKGISEVTFFSSGCLRKIFGDSVEIAYGEGGHLFYTLTQTDRDIEYLPAYNNILDPLSWNGNESIRIFTLDSIVAESDN